MFVYDEGSCEVLCAGELAERLREISGVSVEVRGEFVRHWAEVIGEADQLRTRLARELARARVVDPLSRLQPDREPRPIELEVERRVLETPGKASVGILYDGGAVQGLLADLLPMPARDDCHIVITSRLLGTWVAEDRRWHAHTVLLGEPAIISTSGLVQAPARPSEYYQAQGLATSKLLPREVVEAELQRRLADQMLLPNDPRLTDVAVGCSLQAITFHVTGEAFCSVPTCRLYNARRQQELIRCQCSPEASLCPRHKRFFSELRCRANE